MGETIDKCVKWVSLKVDDFVRMFISQEDLMDIAIKEQKERIKSLKTSLKDLRTARKNLEGYRVENDTKITSAEKQIRSLVTKGKEQLARIRIRFLLDQRLQNKTLDKQIINMKKRDELMKQTLEKVKTIHECSLDKIEYYKTVHSAAKSTLSAIDADVDKRIDLREILHETQREITSMDNKIEVIGELEKEGVLSDEEPMSASDFDVDAALEEFKSEVKPRDKTKGKNKGKK